MRLRLADVELTFGQHGSPVFVLHRCSLTVEPAECLVVLGPSGSGKTTLLRIFAGLERPQAGHVFFGERDVTNDPPERRGAGFVFAEDALFPHLSAYENIAYGVGHNARERVHAAAAALRIEALLERRVERLSGGERQRVAMARALAPEPAALLLDEPLGRLDVPLRVALRLELAAVLRARRTTTILVTHDQSEAMALGDRVAVMRDGRIEQIGTPRDLYERPASVFVAAFVGSPAMAIVAAEPFERYAPPGAVQIGVRADAVSFGAGGDLPGVVYAVEDFGAEAYAYVDTEAGRFVSRLGDARPIAGERLELHIDAAKIHAFDERGLRLAEPVRG